MLTVPQGYASPLRIASALPDGLFEHPARASVTARGRGRCSISKLLERLFNSRLAQTGCGLKRAGDTGTELFPDNGRGFFDVQLLLEDMGH